MADNSQKRTLIALLVVFGVTILGTTLTLVLFSVESFLTEVVLHDTSTAYSWVVSNTPSAHNPGLNIPLLIVKWTFFVPLAALFIRITSPPEDRDRVIELVIGGILGLVVLLPLVWLLVVSFLFLLVKSYREVDSPFGPVVDRTMAELIENQSSKIRNFALSSAALSLAALAFLFSEIDDPSGDPSFPPFVLSILFLFVSIIASEFTLRYKILVEYQSHALIHGILLIFLGIIRSVGQFTVIGSNAIELVFLLIVVLWSVGGQNQRNTHRIVTGKDPRLEESP